MAIVWHNLETVLKNYDTLIRKVEVQIRKNLNKTADAVQKRMIENVSLTDHTMEDLARLGHPYSRRNPRPPHTPPWLVHIRSGDLKRSIKRSKIKGSKNPKVLIGADENIAEHARKVIFGDSKVMARDFVSGTTTEMTREIWRIMTRMPD